MNTVTVNKKNLLLKLQDNLAKHEAEYDDLVNAYRIALTSELKKAQKLLKKSPETFDLQKVLQKFTKKPESSAKEYRLAIQALEWSIEDEIVLDFYDFDKYINDNWNWKSNFELTKSMYMK
jgi:hypothetical protein